MTNRLAIVTTHPIQYYAPMFQLLAQQVEVKVFYTAGNSFLSKYDHGFKQKIEWDIPLLDGYNYEFLTNIASDKGSHHFKGIINPNAIEQINNYKPNAILVYGWSYSSHLKIICHFKNKLPIFFRGDSTLLDQHQNITAILRTIFLTWLYKKIDIAFYVGSANRLYFEKYGLKNKNLVFAPHAIDNHRFSVDRTAEVKALRAELGIKTEDILILFAGKLEPKKNPELLLLGFPKQSNIHLLFVGNGVLEPKLKQRVANENLKNVHFLDFQNQTKMPVIYQSCDLFCLPSKGPGETWGLAINEAMASGKAILVSTKVGCSLDLVTKETGDIFNSEDLDDFKQKIIALTADKNILKKMGYNAFNLIQNWNFTQQATVIANYVNKF